MPVLHARAAAHRGPCHRLRNAMLALIAALAAAVLGACAAPPPAPSLAAAADPGAKVAATRYSSVTAPYTRQRPVEPLPWRERNQRVAPGAGQ
jgi:hypothetical protein